VEPLRLLLLVHVGGALSNGLLPLVVCIAARREGLRREAAFAAAWGIVCSVFCLVLGLVLIGVSFLLIAMGAIDIQGFCVLYVAAWCLVFGATVVVGIVNVRRRSKGASLWYPVRGYVGRLATWVSRIRLTLASTNSRR
jgi:hypothetical protein